MRVVHRGRARVDKLQIKRHLLVGQLRRPAQVKRRALVGNRLERLERPVLVLLFFRVVAVAEVVVRDEVLQVIQLGAIADADRLKRRWPQRSLVAPDPLVAVEHVSAGDAVVAQLDADADPEVRLAGDFARRQIGRPVKPDRARLGKGVGAVDKAEHALLIARRRLAARGALAEDAPLLAVEVLPRQHQVIGSARRGIDRRIADVDLDLDLHAQLRERLLRRQIQAVVNLRLGAERMDVFAQVERDKDVVVQVGKRLVGHDAFADNLDGTAHRIDFGLRGLAWHLGQASANPRRGHAVYRRRLQVRDPGEDDLAALHFQRCHRQLAPAPAVPVLPLEQTGQIAATVLRSGNAQSQHRRLVERDQALVTQIDEAIDALSPGKGQKALVALAADVGRVVRVGLVEVRKRAVQAGADHRQVAHRLKQHRIFFIGLRRADL